MKERIQLLDTAVDIASTREASSATIEYLEQEGSRVIYFLNSETLLHLQENTHWREIVEESSLILPADSNVNQSINGVLKHKRDPFFVESYFDAILDYAIEKGLEFLLVTENEERFISIQENIHAKRPFLTLSGVFVNEQEDSLEHIVNGINSVAPDILMVTLEERKQLELLQCYRKQMNAGLMLFTGNILYNKAVLEAEVPEQIQKLKIDNLYKWFRKGEGIKTFFNNIRIKSRLKQHQKEKNF